MKVTFTYSLTQDEFITAARQLWTHEAIGDKGNWIAATILTAIALLLIIWGIGSGWILLGAAAILAVFTVVRPLLWRRGYNRYVKYTAPITATFGPEMIETSSAEGDSVLPWSAFDSYFETGEFIFIMMGRSFSAVPKSAATPQDLEVFRGYVTANLKVKKKRCI